MINGLGVVGWGKILLVITSSVLKTTFVDFEKRDRALYVASDFVASIYLRILAVSS